MACNSQTPADGATPAAAPSSPARPTAPASCSSPDSLFTPCCNSNCRLPGCSATMNFCANCHAERLLKQECAGVTDNAGIADLLAEGGSERGVITGADTYTVSDVYSVADGSNDGYGTAMAGISVLRSGVRSKGSPVTDEIAVAAPSQQGPSAESRGNEILRIPSPLLLSPPLLADADLATGAAPPRERKVNRCALCSRRLGLLGFKCRCGDLFCASHRYFDSHRCSFDYKAAGRLAIAKENPLVVSRKIVKI